MDIVVVEDGSVADVERLFDLFELGPTPSLITIDDETKEGSLVQLLQRARADKQSIALFGAEEGLPTICDPGWRLMQAARQLDPTPNIKSISSGSAISTALMYTHHRRPEFLFLGLFQHRSGDSRFLQTLDRLVPVPWSNHRSMICYAEGNQLQQEWNGLVSRTRFLRGRLMLLCNLSRTDEYAREFQLSILPDVAPDFIAPGDKVVVRIDWDSSLLDLMWIPRLIRRILTFWR